MRLFDGDLGRRYGKPIAITILTAAVAFGLLVVVAGPQGVGNAIGWLGTIAQNRAVQLAYFYKPPTDQSGAQGLAASQNIIFLTQHDEKFRDQVRQAGYQGKILQYLMANAIDGPAPPHIAPCDPNYVPWPNNAGDHVGDYCSLPEEAFLHNGRGERIYYIYDDFGPESWRTGRHYYTIMNPGNPAWREMWARNMKEDVDTLGYDGLFLDDLDIVPYRPRHRLENSDGTIAEYPNDADYREALRGMLEYVRPSISKPMWANMMGGSNDGSDWDMFMPYLDGGMFEAYALDWVPGYLKPHYWEGQQQQAEKWLKAGKGFLGVAQGPQADTERMKFALSSFMLIDQGDAHFRYSLGDGTSYRKLWHYPEFDVDLGEPLGDRYRDGDTAWKRDFTCGHVRVDPVNQTYEFSPDSSLPTCQQ
jgi:hypothetical protein